MPKLKELLLSLMLYKNGAVQLSPRSSSAYLLNSLLYYMYFSILYPSVITPL